MTRHLYTVPDDAVTQIIPVVDATVIALGILAGGWLISSWVVS